MILFLKTMLGIKDLKNEISKMSGKIIYLSDSIAQSMDRMTNELHETNLTIREALKTTSDTIKEMSINFSKALKDAMKIISEMKVRVEVRDSILKTLGIDKLLPDFLKKTKK